MNAVHDHIPDEQILSEDVDMAFGPLTMTTMAKGPITPPAFDFAAFTDVDFFTPPHSELVAASGILPSTPNWNQIESPRSLQWKAPSIMVQREAKTPEAAMAMTILTQIIRSFPHDVAKGDISSIHTSQALQHWE